MWFDVIQVLAFVAILTNCIILGFSSEQLMQWLPWLYSRDTMGGDQVMAVGSGRSVDWLSCCAICYCLKVRRFKSIQCDL